ncbi:GNAT family N-acetyltransferase [Bacillus sp. AK031]
MKIVQYDKVQKFNDAVRPLLLQEEAENNLPLGLLDQIMEGRYKDPFLAVMEEDGVVHAVFVRTPPHYLIATVLSEDKTEEVAEVLWNYSNEKGLELPGFIGNKITTVKLAEVWSEKTEKPYQVHMRQRIYQLEEVKDIEISEGEMSLAGEDDIDLVKDWLLGFIEDTPEKPIPGEDARKRAEEMIADQSVFLWKVNNVPVSMARRARRTDNGITVNFVYTPKEERRKGYGRSVVATLSKMLLKTNQFCTLYTDLDNPTSNKIYMEIGYVPVCDSMMINIT